MEAGDPFQPLSRNRVPATAVPAEPRGQRQRAVPLSSSNIGCWVLSGTEPETNPGSPEWTAWQGCPLSHRPCAVSLPGQAAGPLSVQSPAWHPEPLHLRFLRLEPPVSLGLALQHRAYRQRGAMTTVFYLFDRIWGAQTSVHRAYEGLRGT